jgi:hypothetical protein
LDLQETIESTGHINSHTAARLASTKHNPRLPVDPNSLPPTDTTQLRYTDVNTFRATDGEKNLESISDHESIWDYPESLGDLSSESQSDEECHADRRKKEAMAWVNECHLFNGYPKQFHWMLAKTKEAPDESNPATPIFNKPSMLAKSNVLKVKSTIKGAPYRSSILMGSEVSHHLVPSDHEDIPVRHVLAPNLNPVSLDPNPKPPSVPSKLILPIPSHSHLYANIPEPGGLRSMLLDNIEEEKQVDNSDGLDPVFRQTLLELEGTWVKTLKYNRDQIRSCRNERDVEGLMRWKETLKENTRLSMILSKFKLLIIRQSKKIKKQD